MPTEKESSSKESLPSKEILAHYTEFSSFTYPGPMMVEELRTKLPDDIREIGKLVRSQTIHRVILRNGNTGSNADLRYGDMTKVPWTRQCEDDNFQTASAMISELYRRDPRGFVLDRAETDKLVVTCRYVSILTASILKSKGIPTRVRSGFAPYFVVEGLPSGKSDDHWINQYWNKDQERWVTIDVDAILENYIPFDRYDIPKGSYDFSADAWLAVREGRADEQHFFNACGTGGLIAIAWELFYDFHSLMNQEIIYMHHPELSTYRTFPTLTEEQLQEIDQLARLLQKPDDNFAKLKNIFETNKKFRILKGSLL